MPTSMRKAPIIKGKNAENFIMREENQLERLKNRTDEIIEKQLSSWKDCKNERR